MAFGKFGKSGSEYKLGLLHSKAHISFIQNDLPFVLAGAYTFLIKTIYYQLASQHFVKVSV
jgi:hypothetical protein